MSEYYIPINGYVKVNAESYDEAISKAQQKILKGDFEYEFGEETVFDEDEIESEG